jgi:hypothetical protein
MQPNEDLLILAQAAETRRAHLQEEIQAAREAEAQTQRDVQQADSQMLINDFLSSVTEPFMLAAQANGFNPEPINVGVGFKGEINLGKWRAILTLTQFPASPSGNARLEMGAVSATGSIYAGVGRAWCLDASPDGPPIRILDGTPELPQVPMEDHLLAWIAQTDAKLK